MCINFSYHKYLNQYFESWLLESFRNCRVYNIRDIKWTLRQLHLNLLPFALFLNDACVSKIHLLTFNSCFLNRISSLVNFPSIDFKIRKMINILETRDMLMCHKIILSQTMSSIETWNLNVYFLCFSNIFGVWLHFW